jgi:hypothetical protein
MQHRAVRALAAAGFSMLFALTAACGGSTPEAKAPGSDPTDAPRVGSSAPDQVSDTSVSSATTEAPKPTPAVASADNGSDIIPPFSSSKEPATKKSGKSTTKKSAAKPTKKKKA